MSVSHPFSCILKVKVNKFSVAKKAPFLYSSLSLEPQLKHAALLFNCPAIASVYSHN